MVSKKRKQQMAMHASMRNRGMGKAPPAMNADLNELPKPRNFAKKTSDNTIKYNTNIDKLQKTHVVEKGNVFETGKPVTFNYMRNTQSAPRHPDPSRFGQDIEPAGKYMILDTKPERTKEYFPEMEQGTITFNNPIVIENVTTTGAPEGWKSRLSVAHGNKTGKALTKELIKKGYDGIVTVDNDHTSEIISLKTKR